MMYQLCGERWPPKGKSRDTAEGLLGATGIDLDTKELGQVDRNRKQHVLVKYMCCL